MTSKVKRLFWTIYHLKPSQLYFRIYYKLLSRKYKAKQYRGNSNFINIISQIESNSSFESQSLSFTFLNRKHSFNEKVNWNFREYGKLWTYNLTYFDYLNQNNISKAEGILLINQFIDRLNTIKEGLEPYPTSLRIINWIKFISRHEIANKDYDDVIFSHAIFLSKNLEYHLLGNHLLENAFALLFSALYLSDPYLFTKAEKILLSELKEQVLDDGAHFELSPMYHCIILHRLLDSINLLRNNNSPNNKKLSAVMIDCSSKMITWIKNVSFQNGETPMFNDSMFGIAPTAVSLINYSERLGIKPIQLPLNESGYRKINTDRIETIIKAGCIGPDYIPGHAHADTFSFVTNIDNTPFIVDTGVSTYEIGELRSYQRSTLAHNTVSSGYENSSDVWSAFRVGRRAKVKLLNETENELHLSHNGYLHLSIVHHRTFKNTNNALIILDKIHSSKQSKTCFACFHFSEDTEIVLTENIVSNSTAGLEFDNYKSIRIEPCDISVGYNQLTKSSKAIVEFSTELKTRLFLKNN